jgi:hypothetical protein
MGFPFYLDYGWNEAQRPLDVAQTDGWTDRWLT